MIISVWFFGLEEESEMKDLDKRQLKVDAVHSGNVFSFKAWPHERQTHGRSSYVEICEPI